MTETFFLGEEDLPVLAEKVASILSTLDKDQASVVLLEGDLGAGKTTFTKALAGVLGVDKEQVHSPTFILKKEYRTGHPRFRKLVHIDAYRFTHPDEARVLRLEEDLQDPQTVVVVEWPNKMTYLQSDVDLEFSVDNENTRQITLTHEKRS